MEYCLPRCIAFRFFGFLQLYPGNILLQRIDGLCLGVNLCLEFLSTLQAACIVSIHLLLPKSSVWRQALPKFAGAVRASCKFWTFHANIKMQVKAAVGIWGSLILEVQKHLRVI